MFAQDCTRFGDTCQMSKAEGVCVNYAIEIGSVGVFGSGVWHANGPVKHRSCEGVSWALWHVEERVICGMLCAGFVTCSF